MTTPMEKETSQDQRKPRVGIFGLTGCGGDQLVILNCEDQLLEISQLVDLRDFVMASSANDKVCPLDVAFVEGAVLSNQDEANLRAIRQRADILIAIGSCAVSGGIPTLDRCVHREKVLERIYGAAAGEYDSIPALGVSEVVEVDVELPGCPIEKDEFLSLLAHLLLNNPPLPPNYSVCTECKMRENECLMNDGVQICLGPLTAAGCNARCPTLGVPCIGCRGLLPDANVTSALALFEEHGIELHEAMMKLRTFGPIESNPSLELEAHHAATD
jgi:sulfhydrogenase subunit delta